MTVNTYVHRDSAGRPWPPAFQHETSALVDIVKRMWSAFHHQPTTYALIGNVHRLGRAKLVENGQTQMVFRLDRDDIVVGRDPTTCTVVIPSQYTRVSKKHLHLWRTAGGAVGVKDGAAS